jgi:hypothetical protein
MAGCNLELQRIQQSHMRHIAEDVANCMRERREPWSWLSVFVSSGEPTEMFEAREAAFDVGSLFVESVVMSGLLHTVDLEGTTATAFTASM